MEAEALQRAFGETPLFADKTWLLSPHAFPLDENQRAGIAAVGPACRAFYLAVEQLYRRATEGRRLLRNGDLEADWVVDYLDRGKPARLVAHGRHPAVKNELPPVIRPDLLPVEGGFCLTELDSVPGGIGLTAFLQGLYGRAEEVLGSAEGMAEAFFRAVTGGEDPYRNPLLAIVVSEEAETYRPEMEWLAEQLQKQGRRVFVFRPEEIFLLGETVCASLDGNPERIDCVYRFWELFDHFDFPWAEGLLEAVERGDLRVTPPLKHYQEEKLNLGLLHHPRLQAFWEEALGKAHRRLLQSLVPRTWIVDPATVPPNAFLHAPTVGGQPIHSWDQLGSGSQRERNLILKISGYHETAWGARSVVLGNDVSREQWTAALRHAVREGGQHLHVLQEYHKPRRVRHPIYSGEGVAREREGRVRLSPFYFADGEEYSWEGTLATVCPADKKIIHGMSEATLLPCGPARATVADTEGPGEAAGREAEA